MIGARIEGDLAAQMDRKIGLMAAAVTDAVTEEGAALQQILRDQVRAAGLGTRMESTWRLQVYPRGAVSMGAAALVYSKAPDIVSAFANGTVIRSKLGLWLAIPTAAVPRGRGGRPLSLLQCENRFGAALRFIFRPGKPGLLVLDNARLGSKGRAARATTRGANGDYVRLSGRTTVVLFVLAPAARMKKLLDTEGPKRAAEASLPARVARNLQRMVS